MGTILVTGGSGFIGTHLCRRLRAMDRSVRVLDLRMPETKVAGVEYLLGDVRQKADILACLDDIDAVVHLAAIVSVMLCQEDPVESEKTNVLGTANVLDCLKNAKSNGEIPRLIFASSAAVYGSLGDNGQPVTETIPLPKPLSFYAAQKFASEQLMHLYHLHFQVPTLSFRFFNVFGRGQDPNSPYSGVISLFQKRLQDQQPLRINGDGEQTRDFVHVSDIVEACVSALAAKKEKFSAAVCNLGSGKKITINQLAKTMQKVSENSSNSKIEYTSPRAGDVRHSVANIESAKHILHWEPKVTLEAGLRELLHP